MRLRNKIVSRATYQRVDRFNVQVGETIERLARLHARSLVVFEGRDVVKQFLMNPHPELDGRTLFDIALMEIGGRKAETYSLTVLENPVHSQTSVLPKTLVCGEVNISDAIGQEQLDLANVPFSPENDYTPCRAIGDDWYDRGEAAVLRVPSVVMFAHPRPVRAVTGELNFTRLGKESFIAIGHDPHHLIGEAPLQQLQHGADLAGTLLTYFFPPLAESGGILMSIL